MTTIKFAALSEIEQPVASGKLTLGRTQLGASLVEFMQRLALIDETLVVAQPVVKQGQGWLGVSGLVRPLFAIADVSMDLRLFDVREDERACLMLMRGENSQLDDLVARWFSAFERDPWEVLTSVEGIDWCVVSSVDIIGFEDEPGQLPAGWPPDLPRAQVTTGMICRATSVGYEEDFVADLGKALGAPLNPILSKSPAAIQLTAPARDWQPGCDEGLTLRLRPVQADDPPSYLSLPILPDFKATLNHTELLLPLNGGDFGGARVCLPGTLKVGGPTSRQCEIEVSATFDLHSETVTASIAKLGSLNELPGFAASVHGDAPDGFDQILDRAAASAWVVLNWASQDHGDSGRETVLAVGGAVRVDPKAPLALVPDHLTFAPSLRLQVDHPFTPNQREVSGRMEGTLTLLHEAKSAAELSASLEFPGWYFTAHADVAVGRLMDALGLNAIAMPESLSSATVALSLSGDVATKSFGAELEFAIDKTWGGNDSQFTLSQLLIGVDYDGHEGEFGFTISAQLCVSEFVEFKVSGGYDGGWLLSGEMAEGAQFDVSLAMNSLLGGLKLPWTLPHDLALADVAFNAEFSTGNFGLRGRTAGPWKLGEAFELSVKALEFKRARPSATGVRPTSGSSAPVSEWPAERAITATILLELSLDSVDLFLEASTPQDAKAGWLFKGQSRPGQRILIGEILQSLLDKVKAAGAGAAPAPLQLPEVLRSLEIQNLTASFDTGTKAFAFACESSLSFGRDQPALRCTVDVEVKNGQVHLGGTLDVAGLCFSLDFEASSGKTALSAHLRADGAASAPTLDLAALGRAYSLPVLQGSKVLTLQSAKLQLELQEERQCLSIGCILGYGGPANFPFVLRVMKAQGVWQAVFGMRLPPITTQDMGALGNALAPHHLALEDLVVVAASGASKSPLILQDAPEKSVDVERGLFLQGRLSFADTSSSYDFECRLGNEAKPAALPEDQSIPGGGTEEQKGKNKGEEKNQGKSKGDGEPPPPAKNNIDVGRTIGPVTFRRARLESRDQRVHLGFDASIGSGSFSLELSGFDLNFPLALLTDPSQLGQIQVGLDGLSMSYASGPLTISGGFSKASLAESEGESSYFGDRYQGHLLVKAATFQVTVLGSYGTILLHGEKRPSLFLYGSYVGVIGGPPAFFVTGLALGGGYNSRLVLPAVEDVADYPLVQAVTAPEKFTTHSLGEMIEPSAGDYWLAAGVKFNSFKAADSFALFSVSFGNRLQFARLGLTTLSLPAEADETGRVVHAELAIRAVLDPAAGVFGIEGRLTDNSYILDKEFHLVGGFAFFVWFGDAPTAGDFVITLGGYHPEFPRPAHYPIVPRVGIRAQLSDALTVTGEAYLALTPSCAMCGLKLAAAFDTAELSASFLVYADFVVAWAPFRYDAQVGMAIQIAFGELRQFKIEAHATLHVSGPPFSGTAVISIAFVSLAIEFGTQQPRKERVQWEEFRKSFLPASVSKERAAPNAVRISHGVVREVKCGDTTYRIVNPHELTIETDSVVPCNALVLGKNRLLTGSAAIGIRPMGVRNLESTHEIRIEAVDRKTDSTNPARRDHRCSVQGVKEPRPRPEDLFSVQGSRKNYPQALWSPTAAPAKPGNGMVEGAISGAILRVMPRQPEQDRMVGPLPIADFQFEEIPKTIPWSLHPAVPPQLPDAWPAPGPFPSQEHEFRRQVREYLVRSLPGSVESPWNDIDLTHTATSPDDRFQAPPAWLALDGMALAPP